MASAPRSSALPQGHLQGPPACRGIQRGPGWTGWPWGTSSSLCHGGGCGGKASLCPFLCPHGPSGGSQAVFSLSSPPPSLVRGRRAHVRSDNLLRGSGASLWGLTAAPRSQRSNTPIVRGWVLGGGTEAGDTGPPASHTSLSTPPGPRQGALGGGDLLLALGLCRS